MKPDPGDEIVKRAKIYGTKDDSKPFRDYEVKVNEAAGRLAIENPLLLTNRGNHGHKLYIYFILKQ